MFKKLLFILVVIIGTNCTEEEKNLKADLEPKVPKIELRNSTVDFIHSNKHLVESPGNELIQEMYSILKDQDEWDDINQKLLDNNCRVRWNWSSLDRMDGDDYTVMIPVTNAEKAICMYIFYAAVGPSAHFTIMTINELKEVTENFTKVDVDSKYLPYIIKTAVYDYYYYQRTDNRLANWIQNYFALNLSDIEPAYQNG